MIDPKLLDIWKDILKVNDEIIKTCDSILSTCFIVNKDYSMQILAMIWRTPDEKNKMKDFIKKLIINQEILGYGLIADSYMTNMETKEVQEVVMRNFYTPKEALYNNIIHKDKKIIGEFEMPKGVKFSDTWNLWNKTEIDEETNEKSEIEYDKFRREHSELYGEKK